MHTCITSHKSLGEDILWNFPKTHTVLIFHTFFWESMGDYSGDYSDESSGSDYDDGNYLTFSHYFIFAIFLFDFLFIQN